MISMWTQQMGAIIITALHLFFLFSYTGYILFNKSLAHDANLMSLLNTT